MPRSIPRPPSGSSEPSPLRVSLETAGALHDNLSSTWAKVDKLGHVATLTPADNVMRTGRKLFVPPFVDWSEQDQLGAEVSMHHTKTGRRDPDEFSLVARRFINVFAGDHLRVLAIAERYNAALWKDHGTVALDSVISVEHVDGKPLQTRLPDFEPPLEQVLAAASLQESDLDAGVLRDPHESFRRLNVRLPLIQQGISAAWPAA
jgi:hypothetical protein